MLNNAYESQQLDFLHLCSLGDEQRVRDALLSGRVDVNYRHKSNGWTALHWASNRGFYEICLLLIEAGYPLNVEDSKGRIPFELCPADKEKIRDLLQPAEIEENDENDMVQNNVSRRSSDVSQKNTPGFVPNYIRNPPFPYSMKNSFDSYNAPNSPASPGPLNSPTYSYGRRDSFNKTRFLLVRTSVEKGKETYKRVTLPGGSDVERLKITIEKACKGKAVDMIFTLPENELVEFDEQIHAFKDCQKIDVVFKNVEEIVAVPDSTAEQKGNMSDEKERVVEKDYSENVNKSEDIDIPSNEDTSIVKLGESEENVEESTTETPAEDLSSFVREPSPPVSLTTTDFDSNNGTENDEPKLIPLATRNSLDSDPGDFEKVDKEEAKLGDATTSPAVAGIAANIPIITAQVEEEAKYAPPASETEQPFVPSEKENEPARSKATVVEESKQVPEDHESNDIAAWINNNPELVRNIATAAAVAGVAGLGYYVYVKKFK